MKESKFGVAFEDAPRLYRRAAGLPGVEVRGIDCHIGSQITELVGLRRGRRRRCSSWSIGSRRTASPSITSTWAAGSASATATRKRSIRTPIALAVREARGARRHELLFEPGRFLVGDAGVLLTRVLYLKPGEGHDFAIVDAAMNDLLRPALYDAWHDGRTRAAARRAGAALADRRTGVRERRFPRARPPARPGGRRPPRRARRRRVRVRDELQLQLAPARLRGRRRRRHACISSVRARTRRIFSRANPRCPERISAAHRQVREARFLRCAYPQQSRMQREESAEKSCNSTKCG